MDISRASLTGLRVLSVGCTSRGLGGGGIGTIGTIGG